MPVPTDLCINDRIALAKGWTWNTTAECAVRANRYTHWADSEGVPRLRPDYVGTLEGVSGMLWELGEEWTLHPDPPNGWLLWRDEFVYGVAQTFDSPREKLGDCVAGAWLYVFGKEEI